MSTDDVAIQSTKLKKEIQKHERNSYYVIIPWHFYVHLGWWTCVCVRGKNKEKELQTSASECELSIEKGNKVERILHIEWM